MVDWHKSQCFIAFPLYEGPRGIVARRYWSVKILLSFAIIFFMLVSVPTPIDHPETNVAHSSANGSRQFVVGGLDFTNSVSTLSPFRYTSYQEKMTIWPCMSTLVTYDVEGNLIGDIADSWTVSTDGLTWHFKMQPDIYFTDPANPTAKTHQLTWVDIQYTYFQVQNYTNSLQSSLYFGDPWAGTGQGVISRVWGNSAANFVNITLSMPYAPFLSALTGIPIIPKYYWQPHEASGDATRWTAALPVGSGPWYYGHAGLPTSGEVSLLRSPIWFQESNRGWQMRVDTLKYRTELSPDDGWADLKSGAIDLFMDVPSSFYLNNLPGEPSLIGWAQSTGFVYEYNLCQMTNIMRSQLGTPYSYGSNNQLLLDPIVKRALAMAVDKQGFVDTVLSGFGSPADSLVPETNSWHYCPVNQVAFDLAGANALLQSNGYVDMDADGIREATASSPAVLSGLASVGSELRFRFFTLYSSTEWMQGGTLIQDWAAQIGVDLNLTILTVGQMNSAWMKADYDAFLWDWEFTSSSDPSIDVLQVLTTDRIGTWQDLYWSNKTFDSLYNMSVVEMDPAARRVLTNEMQQMAYDNMGCQPVAYKTRLYVSNCLRWALSSYEGCGSKWTLCPDEAFCWLYAQLSPADNLAPAASTAPSFQCQVGTPYEFVGTATDASPLQFRWYWGDGTSTGWQATPMVSHDYSEGGVYTAYLAAREVGTADAYIGYAKTTVYVTDPSNTPPHDLSFTTLPARLEALRQVNFTGYATDDQGDYLSYSWDFGDSSSGAGRNPRHTYATPGNYTVTMFVTDNQPGEGRPVSYAKVLAVGPVNSPPSLTVRPSYLYTWNVETWFTVNASDVDADPLRFTWDWGDGLLSVTSTPYATHVYSKKQGYTMTVYADDQSGVAGHNVSGSASMMYGGGAQVPPVIETFIVSPLIALVGQLITVSATATDYNGGPIRITFQFTGTPNEYAVLNSEPLISGQPFTAMVTHSYAVPGTKSVSVYAVDDAGNNVTTISRSVNILSSTEVIVVAPLPPVTAVAGQILSFEADAYSPSYPELRYTWDFGDGSSLVVGNPVSHSYSIPGEYTYTVHVDDLSGLVGHNVSQSATATIGFMMHLFAGWNLVNIPLSGDLMASTLGLLPGDEIVRWNSSTQSYDKIYIVGVSPPSQDFPLTANSPYWIFSGTTEDLVIYGSEPPVSSRWIQVSPGGGWAFIGLSSWHTPGLRAHDVAAMFDPPTVMMVVRWNAPGRYYQTFIAAIPGLNDFALTIGEGYWVYLSGSSMFTPPS